MVKRGAALLGLALVCGVGTVFAGAHAFVEAYSRDVPWWAEPLFYLSLLATVALLLAGVAILARAVWGAMRRR